MSNIATRRTRPNYLYSMISVALVLFVLGVFGVILLHAQQFVRLYKERVNLIVELDETATIIDMVNLESYLNNAAFVRPGTIQTVSKEKAAEMMRDEFGESFLKLDLPNPFLDVVFFNLKAEYLDPRKLQKIREEIKALNAINDVYYQESLIDNIANNLKKAGYFALGFGLFFILVSATLIHNTIRLALYSNRFLIKNMELVGASWSFISRPYLLRAILHGMLSSLIAILALVGLIYWLNHSFPEAYLFQDIRLLLLVIFGIVFLGVLIYASSTFYVVNKYLKMRVDDLY